MGEQNTTSGKGCGKVYLVGAGPGDPGLITARGLDVLRRADVVVFDALANPRLLSEAPAGARKIDVGKRSSAHTLTQDQTNQLLVDEAKGPGSPTVVRLKGGDPYLFGRGAEEAAYLHRHGVACEVIPGVTSGIAGPAAAGIPVTHREVASTVTLVTGHEDPTKEGSAIDYAALAGLIKAGGTVCFYMGMSRLGSIAGTLMGEGVGSDMPAAVVQWGTTPRQRSARGTLATIAGVVEREKLGSPAIVVVGRVAGLREVGLDGFTQRSLFGRRVIVTRTRHQASALSAMLLERGAEVLEAPTIEIEPPEVETLKRVDERIRGIREYDWVVLTSINGVGAMAERLEVMGLDGRHLAGVRVAAIGPGTEEMLREKIGIKADLVPGRFVAESLAGELLAKQEVKGKKFLLLRADIARPALPKMLEEAGAVVEDLCVYQTRRAKELPGEVVEALRKGEVDWVTFTSASTAKYMVELLGEEAGLLKRVKCASIGPVTSAAMKELGIEVAAEAGEASLEGLVRVMEGAGDPTQA